MTNADSANATVEVSSFPHAEEGRPETADPTGPANATEHGLVSGQMASAFVYPSTPCGMDERQEIYKRANIPRQHWAELERVIEEAPARDVGAGALNNVVGGLYSKKSLDIRTFESHTVERLHLYHLELAPDVVAYRTQARLHNVEGTDSLGRRKTWPVTADMIVLREASVTIVECKSRTWLEKEARKPNSTWSYVDGKWNSRAHESWASARGLQFEVVARDEICGVELQNLEFIYAMSRQTGTGRDETIMCRAKDVLASGPKTVVELCAHVPGFSNRHTGIMLGRRLAYGMLRSQSISLEDTFLLFDDESHALDADRIAFNETAASFMPIEISRPILTATSRDAAIARARLQRIEEMRAGTSPGNDRTRRLERRMLAGVAQGLTEEEALLGRTHKCGNRGPKLDPAQINAVASTVHNYWENGKLSDLDDLYFELKRECEVLQTTAPSKSTLRLAANAASKKKRALALGGMRAYQGIRNITPPDRSSLPPIAYGHTLHIDSSILDNRSAPNLITQFPAEKARFYVGVDGATSKPMGHALLFGPARTDGLAILMREYVSRNGFLPSLIIVDRGTENTSKWFKEFCEEAGITWMYAPTAGSSYNGLAENIIGRINSQVAHKLPGSSKPDQKGRAVDGKFKSRKTAQIAFEQIANEFRIYVFEDIPRTPNQDNVTPNELAEELQRFGEFAGKAATLDPAFLVLTSVPTNTAPKVEHGYIRTSYGKFSSVEFQAGVSNGKRVDDLRRDCVDPSVMYARVGITWYQIFNRAVLHLRQLTDIEKLWKMLSRPLSSSDARAARRVIKEDRYRRHQEMKEGSAAHKAVSPDATAAQPPPDSAPPPDQQFSWDDLNDFH